MQILLTTLLWLGGPAAAVADVSTPAELVSVWTERMTKDPRRTGREVAEYFNRLPRAEWRDAFATELLFLTALGGASAAAVDHQPEDARYFAASFLAQAHARFTPAFADLIEVLFKLDGTFWTDHLITELIERRSPRVNLLIKVLPFVPPAGYPRAARAIAAASHDARHAQTLMDALVIAHAWRQTPLELPPVDDPWVDRHCARLLGESRRLVTDHWSSGKRRGRAR